MDERKFRTTIIKRFNNLISLLLDVASAERSLSTTEKIKRLSDLGLTPAEIAEILGKETNYVTAVIHRKKKKKKRD